MEGFMEALNKIAEILANPWVGRALAVIFAAAGIFFKFKLDSAKLLIKEIRDIAEVHKDATDPKSPDGVKYSKEEQDALQKEAVEVLAVIGEMIARKQTK